MISFRKISGIILYLIYFYSDNEISEIRVVISNRVLRPEDYVHITTKNSTDRTYAKKLAQL